MSRTIGWYNGWNGAERLAVLPVLREAVASGQVQPPSQCSICLTPGSSDWRADNAIVFHDEDYGRPLEAYPICKPCHGLVHLRFWRTSEWASHLAQHGRGGGWFELLTMDPGSRYRPFAGTYPAGLPRAFEP